MKQAKVIISIIIPCLNEASVVSKLLDQLLTHVNDNIEVIAVDNRSTDKTLMVLNSYQHKGLRVVSDVDKGVSKARNAGAGAACGKWLVFIDADSLVSADFIDGLLYQLSDDRTNFALAMLNYHAQSSKWLLRLVVYLAKWYQWLYFFIFRRPIIPGSDIIILKSLHDKIGGFNEKIKYNEDFEYSLRAYKNNPRFHALLSPSIYFSVRRLEGGGLWKVIKTYSYAEVARIFGKKYDPKDYDMSNHRMK